jgi:hypothetical protein
LTRHRDQTALFVARNTAENVKQLARQMARVDDRRAASLFHTQGQELAPVRPPNMEELKASLEKLTADIARKLGRPEPAETPRPIERSGFEGWTQAGGMAAQQRSALKVAKKVANDHAQPQTSRPSQKDVLAQLARLSNPEPSSREAALARILDRTEPAKTLTPAPRVAAPAPTKAPQPAKAPSAAPPTSRPLGANEVFARFGSARAQARYQFQHQQAASWKPTNTPETPASSFARGNVPAEKQAEHAAAKEKTTRQRYITRDLPEDRRERGMERDGGRGRGGRGGRGGRTR